MVLLLKSLQSDDGLLHSGSLNMSRRRREERPKLSLTYVDLLESEGVARAYRTQQGTVGYMSSLWEVLERYVPTNLSQSREEARSSGRYLDSLGYAQGYFTRFFLRALATGEVVNKFGETGFLTNVLKVYLDNLVITYHVSVAGPLNIGMCRRDNMALVYTAAPLSVGGVELTDLPAGIQELTRTDVPKLVTYGDVRRHAEWGSIEASEERRNWPHGDSASWVFIEGELFKRTYASDISFIRVLACENLI